MGSEPRCVRCSPSVTSATPKHRPPPLRRHNPMVLPPFRREAASRSPSHVFRTALYVPFKEATAYAALRLRFPLSPGAGAGNEPQSSNVPQAAAAALLGAAGAAWVGGSAALLLPAWGSWTQDLRRRWCSAPIPGTRSGKPGSPRMGKMSSIDRPSLTAQQLPALVGKCTRVSPGWQRRQRFGEAVTRDSQLMKSSCPTCVSICNLPSVWFSCIH